MEILIAIFVLMIGLLGVAAVIPLGRIEMLEAGKADRSAACAHAALREVKVRAILDPRVWRYPNGNPVAVAENDRLWIPYGVTFYIDPLFVSSNSGEPNIDRVPFGASAPTTLSRITLDIPSSVFIWHDDLMFHVPSDPSDRPRSMEFVFNPAATNPENKFRTLPWPVRPEDSVPEYDPDNPPVPLKSLNQGDFTWAVMVVPHPPAGYLGAFPLDEVTTFSVSVVIYYKRNLATLSAEPSERGIDTVQFLAGGWGGGDVWLRDADDPPTDLLQIEAGDWLAVYGGSVPGAYQWYQVIGTGDEPTKNGSSWERMVTLRGPDYSIPYDTNNDGVVDGGVLFSDVVGVFTSTVNLEDL